MHDIHRRFSDKFRSNWIKVKFYKEKPDLDNFEPHLNEKNSQVLERAFSQMLQRCEKFNIDLTPCNDWLLELNVDEEKLTVSYENRRLVKDGDEVYSDAKVLSIKLTEKQFGVLMNRELHWDNAQIGLHLNFKRNPNEYCQELYKSLNFLHL